MVEYLLTCGRTARKILKPSALRFGVPWLISLRQFLVITRILIPCSQLETVSDCLHRFHYQFMLMKALTLWLVNAQVLCHLSRRCDCIKRLRFWWGSVLPISVDNCVALPGWSLEQGQKQGEEALLSPSLGPLIEGSPKGPNLRGQTEVNWFRIFSTSQKNQKTLNQIQRVREKRRGVYFAPQLEGTAIMVGKVLRWALKQLVTLYPHSGRGRAGAQLAFPLLFSLRPKPTNGAAHS